MDPDSCISMNFINNPKEHGEKHDNSNSVFDSKVMKRYLDHCLETKYNHKYSEGPSLPRGCSSICSMQIDRNCDTEKYPSEETANEHHERRGRIHCTKRFGWEFAKNTYATDAG